jgi:hypothetical protein
MKKAIVCALLLPMLSLHAADGNDLAFLEAFAWGDRSAALSQLVPDTDDYFFYHCLHYQLAGEREAFQKTLDKWVSRNHGNWNERMSELRRRQMLLDIDRTPGAVWTFLKQDAGLSFNHRARHEQTSQRQPSVIKPEQYSLDAFWRQANPFGSPLDQLTDRGLELLPDPNANPDVRRAFLRRLSRPDYPGLVKLILADLDYKDQQGNITAFGQMPIHKALTTDQLVDLGTQRPALLREADYVNARLARMEPPDADLANDSAAAVAYLEELWRFVEPLEPIHNSLKSNILYQLLVHQRKLGVYDAARFRTYVELPRQWGFIHRDRMSRLRRERAVWVNVNYTPGVPGSLPPIGNDEPLIREFLIDLLKDAGDASRFADIFEARWLDAVFAESKILHGVGTPAQWSSKLGPEAYRALLERIELDFAPQNPTYFKPGQPVELAVDLKRVDRLLVKVFEIQTFNYYTTRRAAIDQAVELDGMIASHERTLDTAADPSRRMRHRLALPEIKTRGVYVVELIGNGVSSRALLYVGHLEAISQVTPAGLAVLVLNDAGETVKDAAVWVDGREFTANDRGLVMLPFTDTPGNRFAVLRSGDFCSAQQIEMRDEAYSFSAGIHLDPQNLPRQKRGMMILRPDFRIHGIPLDPALLGEVTVTLTSVDAKGISSAREYKATFARNTEWTESFYVPDALRSLSVTVEAKLKRKRDLEEITLGDQRSVELNPARRGDTLSQVFLVPAADGWRLEVRGLTGEPIEAVPLNVDLYHPGFKNNLSIQASTDADGTVNLGPLTALSRISVAGPGSLRLDRYLSGADVVWPDRLHLQAGEAVSLPYPFDRHADLRRVSLFKRHGDTILNDRTERVVLKDGELRIEGLDAGTYQLVSHENGRRVQIEVVDAEVRAGYLLAKTRRLQQTGNRLPSVAEVVEKDGALRLQLRNVTTGTRVAVRASRFEDIGSLFPKGSGFYGANTRDMLPPYAQYANGRRIGDEYRYVLERRSQEKFAGTLLERPGLILNPWELRETTTEQERLKGDQAYASERQALGVYGGAVGKYGGGGSSGSSQPIDIGYDFLPQGSKWVVNAVPDKNGVVTIALGNSPEHTALDILVLDGFGHSRFRHLRPYQSFKPVDQRLLSGLDPEKSFSRQKRIRALAAGETVTFADAATTRYRAINTLGQAFDLLQVLSGNATVPEFAFLKSWPTLDDAAKRENYGKYACHEINLFLQQHDPDFFNRVIKPALVCKKDKTFVDRWLLGTLTAEDLRLDRLQQRNALELALLARRGGNASQMQAALREAWELLPPNPDAFARLVHTALQSGGPWDERTKGLYNPCFMQIPDELTENSPVAMKGMIGSRSLGAKGAALGKRDHEVQASAPPAPAEEVEISLAMAEGMADEKMPGESVLFEMSGDDLGGEDVRLYRALPATKEWAEQNYYRVRAKEDTPERLTANGFWLDVASGKAVPENLLEAHRNLTEVITALAFCGLPFEAEPVAEKTGDDGLTFNASSPVLLVTEQVLPAEVAADDRPLLISQQFFRPDDLHRFEGNEKIEKFIAGEFVRRVVYGGRVTLTNPTASLRTLNVLRQLPVGAIPLRDGVMTDDGVVRLEPYTTRKIEYFFVFPFAGQFAQFPAQAAVGETVVGRAEARRFNVVDEPTEVDKTSWAWISQYAPADDVLAFLKTENLRRLELNEIAWRLKDRDFFNRVTDLLTARGLFHNTTFSYGIYHKDADRARIWLARSSLAGGVGPVLESPLLHFPLPGGFGRGGGVGLVLESPLLRVDPVESKVYEHLEYDPLVNPRVHPVGEKYRILNTALDAQYRAFLRTAAYRAKWPAGERLALVYYLLLQDRLAEGIAQLAKIDDTDLHEKVQADYLLAWVALRQLDVDRAKRLAESYTDYPLPRWQARFRAMMQVIADAQGAEVAALDTPNRQQDLDQQAQQSPSLALKAETGKLWLTAYAVGEVTLNLYPMDIELMFSRKPFLAEGATDFAVIRPALSQTLTVKANGEPEELVLPADYAKRNLMVEVVGRGRRAATAWYANQLRVRLIQDYGQVDVRSAKDGKPLPTTYVKVFARGADGREQFWKDGYTDLRGRFDYLSRNDRKPEEAVEFAILVLHPEMGAEIHNATPPAR